MSRAIFSTEHMPSYLSREQLAQLWCDGFSSAPLKYEATCPKPDAFVGRCETVTVGPMCLTRATANSIVLHRRRSHFAQDGQARLSVLVNDGTGLLGGEQRGRSVTLRPGEIALFDMTEDNVTHSIDGNSAMGLYIDLEAIERAGVDLGALAARTLDPADAATRLLRGYLRAQMTLDAADETLGLLAQKHIEDLLLLSIGVKGDTRVQAFGGGFARARLLALRRIVRTRAHERDLNADAVGATLGLSGRTVQHIFAQFETTFSTELLNCRLDMAHAALRNPALASARITDLAYEVGFSDLSTFYRAFKRRYGFAPGEARDPAR